jgi:hypothetical protein
MSDWGQGPGWWQAADGKWYAPPGPAAGPPPSFPPPAAYGYGYPPQAGPKTNGLAIAALVCGVGGLFGGFITCGLLAPAVIVGLVLGHVALTQIKRDPQQQGRGMALAGVIIGWVTIGLTLLLVAVALLV